MADTDQPAETLSVQRAAWWRVRGWLLWAAILAFVVWGKTLQNRLQLEHARQRPIRMRALYQESSQIRARYWPVVQRLVGSSLQEVHTKLDPDGSMARSGGWRIGTSTGLSRLVVYRDPLSGHNLQFLFARDRLVNAWVEPLAFVDPPVLLWDLAEWIRKTGAIVAALLWLICMAGAYYEPRFRRRLAKCALFLASIAVVCWWVEPPEAIRGGDFRLPGGIYIGGAMIALSLLPFIVRRRSETGHCQRCRYDLTGNLSGVCPECGQPTPAELIRRRRETSAGFALAFDSPAPPHEDFQPPSDEPPACLA